MRAFDAEIVDPVQEVENVVTLDAKVEERVEDLGTAVGERERADVGTRRREVEGLTARAADDRLGDFDQPGSGGSTSTDRSP